MASRTAPTAGSQGGEPPLPGAAAPVVTPGFHPLADFAAFRDADAQMLATCAGGIALFSDSIASDLARRLGPVLAAAGIEATIDQAAVAAWLVASCTGPFDAAFAERTRSLSRFGPGLATFPGVSAPMPAQLIVATMAWIQGQGLLALGELTDAITLSCLSGIWMDELLLQLGIILEPVFEPVRDSPDPAGSGSDPAAPDHESVFIPAGGDPGRKAVLHPYADLAGFGEAEGRILEETGSLLSPLADGVISLAYSYLLTRPESAGYFRDAEHLAQRKRTLKAWWIRTASDPFDPGASFGDYLRKVAKAHVRDAGTHPDVEIPAQLTIALMAWVELRVMAALNTISLALDRGGSDPFSVFGGDPRALAEVARAWMGMLTLQLGILLEPHIG